MADDLIQFEINEILKIQAEIICNKLGIDLETYLRICITKLISNNGIPFNIVLIDKSSKATQAQFEMGRISKENGNSEMSLDEINEEIRLAKEAIDARKLKK